MSDCCGGFDDDDDQVVAGVLWSLFGQEVSAAVDDLVKLIP